MSENFLISVKDESIEQVKIIKKAFDIANISWSNWVTCLMINQFEEQNWGKALDKLMGKKVEDDEDE